MEPRPTGRLFTDYYCPLEAGYKDRSGVLPYDRAAARAGSATYTPPSQGAGETERALFVGRLPREAEEADLEKVFARFGALQEVRLIRDLVTGAPRGYAFVVFARRRDAAAASAACRRLCVLGADVVVERELGHTLPGWKPRRLGGGLGGRKESGQLRFGGSARPFQPNPAARAQTGAAPVPRRRSPADTGRESDPRHRSRAPGRRTAERHSGPEQGPELRTDCNDQAQGRRDSERHRRSRDRSGRESGRRREGDGDPGRSERWTPGEHSSQSARHRSSDSRRSRQSPSRAADSATGAAESHGHRKERRKPHDKDREAGKRRHREEEGKGGRHRRDREHRRHRKEKGSPHL